MALLERTNDAWEDRYGVVQIVMPEETDDTQLRFCYYNDGPFVNRPLMIAPTSGVAERLLHRVHVVVEPLDGLLFDALDFRVKLLDFVVDFIAAILAVGLFIESFFDSRGVMFNAFSPLRALLSILKAENKRKPCQPSDWFQGRP